MLFEKVSMRWFCNRYNFFASSYTILFFTVKYNASCQQRQQPYSTDKIIEKITFVFLLLSKWLLKAI